MEGKMSNKFLKILGICVLIVLLPVFIAVTAVCLVEDTNEMNDAKLPTYSVNCGDYAESVKIKEKDGKWIFVSMPVRTGYELTNIKVDGKTYAIKDGAVVLTAETEEAFETAVTGEKAITGVWTCDYNSLWVGIAGTLEDYCLTPGNGFFDIESTNLALENVNVLTALGYQRFSTYPITSLTVRIDSDGDGLVEDQDNAVYTITFNEGDKTDGGDFTLSTLIEKLEEKGATINVDSDKYTEFELSIA